MSGTTRYAEALAALETGQTVITGSRRLARELALAYADRRGDREEIWERPQVLPWSEWLRELWQQLRWHAPESESEALLGTGRRQLLWEQVIAAGIETESLLRVHSLARSAIEAWDLVWDWRIEKASLAMHASEDGKRFLEWAAGFESRCAAGGWLDPARLPERLIAMLPGAPPDLLPDAVTLAGFDEVTPGQQALLDSLRACGTSVSIASASCGKSMRPIVTACGDHATEVRCAALWAEEKLAAEPGATIGIVIPDLAKRHETVARLLAETLAPGNSERLETGDPPVFSVSAGGSLATHPLASAALNLLSLASGQPSWTRISQFLRSPFVGDWASEAAARAELDVRLRDCGGTHWPLERLADELAQAAEANRPWQCKALLRRLGKAWQHRKDWPATQSLRGWITTLSDWLGILGWPGERTLGSEEFQLQERWRALLEELAGLDDLMGGVDLQVAIGLIRNHAATTTFKPESGRAPILALGVFEAAGLEFDHLWVCGLHDGAWPPAPAPVPFIAHRLQRELMLPRGSAARELAFARIQLARLVASAAEVRLSYPLLSDDEALRPSPMLEGFDCGQATDQQAANLHSRVLAIHESRPELEQIIDGVAPRWEKRAAPGGARLIELQALCPFRAFAEFRLGAARLEQPTAGLDPRQRGQLAHESLQRIWNQIPGNEKLRQLTSHEREALVVEALDKAARKLRRVARDPVQRASLAIERERLQSLLLQLLDLEAERAPFAVVANEQSYAASLAGLELAVRPDRVDRLANGHLVIDYKTGRVQIADWFGSRPRAPQLPLYASEIGLNDVKGVAFVQLRAGDLRYLGVGDDQEDLPSGVKPLSNRQRQAQQIDDWQGLLRSWRVTLEKLVAEFAAGDARVDPQKQACTYCHLAGLCRLEEKKRNGEVEPDV